jgi:Spy/CpxP family protein refolding chaperone
MRFAIITLAAALSVAAVAPAQAQDTEQRRPRMRAEQMDPTQHVERRVQMLTQRLELSADQAAKVKSILTQESEQLKAHFQKARPDSAQRPTPEQRQAFRAEMQKVREHTKGEIAKVLNADQLKKYQELQQRGQRRMDGQRRHDRMPRQQQGA